MTPIESAIDACVRPVAKSDNLKEGDIYATHEGLLKIGDVILPVAVLSDGTRVFKEEGLIEWLENLPDG